MDNLSHFLTYAGEFEKSYKDDEWTRLTQYFHDDAMYEIRGLGIDCQITGPAAIFRGIKKSLDGFDRRFAGREIAIISGPESAGDHVRAGWTVTYTKPGLTPFVLRGSTEVRYRDGKIAYLADSYDENMAKEAAAWSKDNSFKIDPSYV